MTKRNSGNLLVAALTIGCLMLTAGCKHDVGETCAAAEECKEGLICHKEVCFRPVAKGGECNEAAECVDGLKCYGRKCFAPLKAGNKCESGAQCTDGLRSYKDRCFAPLAQGGACEDQAQCGGELKCYAGSCQTAQAVKQAKDALVDAAMAGLDEIEAGCGEHFLKAFKRWEVHMKRATRLLDSVDPGTMTMGDRDRLERASAEQWKADRIMRRMDRDIKKAGVAFGKLRQNNTLIQAWVKPWIDGTWDANHVDLLKKMSVDKAKKRVEFLVDKKWGQAICDKSLKKDVLKKKLAGLAG